MQANHHRTIASLLVVGLLSLAGLPVELRAQGVASDDAESAATKPKKNWYLRGNPTSCAGQNLVCAIFFEPVPAGKLVTLSNVSCTFRGLDVTLNTIKLTVTKNDRALTTVRLRPTPVGLTPVLASRNFAVNDDITVYVAGGEQAIVSAEASGIASASATMTCHIAGALQ